MNLFDEFYSSLPINDIVLHTNLERGALFAWLERSARAPLIHWGKGPYCLYKFKQQGLYFTLSGTLMKQDGERMYENDIWVGVYFIWVRIRAGLSPVFYGRVYDEAGGSEIRGHFGLPQPLALLLVVLALLSAAYYYPALRQGGYSIGLLLALVSVNSLIQFNAERKEILGLLGRAAGVNRK